MNPSPTFALIWALALLNAAAQGAAPAPAVGPFEQPGPPTPRNQVDELVFRRLEQLGLKPAHVCSDAVFARRAWLDVIGTLPTPQEARTFLADSSPNKRSALIERLLARDEFADYWAMKWSDLLRVKSEFPINLWPNAVQAYHRWIREGLRQNLPYDQFARELLTASGSNFRAPQVNFYRALQSKEPPAIAQAVALTFMGVRPAAWSNARWTGMAAFFSQVGYKCTAEWKEEIVIFDPQKTSTNPPPAAVFPDGLPAALTPGRDPREVFADWLIHPANPWFTANIANRVWSWLLGRGIVHEPDDFRPDNPPSNPELLALLERELIAAHYDLKRLFRLILNSTTYQLSSIPQARQPEAEANFACYPLRRLEAEVLIDALDQITGTTEDYSSPIPEPFTFVPEDQRSIALADASITSSFLELFGRPARDTGLESERNNRATAAQCLHLLNSSHLQRKLEQGPKLRAFLQSAENPRQVVNRLYLLILSRLPTGQELDAATQYAQSSGATGREGAIDLAWALINTPEFLYRH